MSLRQRTPRHEDKAHLAFVRAQPCCIGGCTRAAEAAHVRFACLARGKEASGMQEKPDDRWTVPLCPYHHRIGIDSQHANNEKEWWAMRGLDPFAIAERLWIQPGGAARAAMPAPIKVRKIKTRKPPERRKKIPAGRPLKSNPVIQSRGFEKRVSS